MQGLEGAHVPHLHLRVRTARHQVPPRGVNRAAPHRAAVAEHGDQGAAHVGAPHGDAPVAVATHQHTVVRVAAQHPARAQPGAVLRHQGARAGVLPPHDASLAAAGQQEEAVQELQAQRVLVLLQAVHLQATLVVDVHVPGGEGGRDGRE